MASIVRNDYEDSDRVQFIKCKFEDLPTDCIDVSIFMRGNTVYFVDNNTIPHQYERIISKNENDYFEEKMQKLRDLEKQEAFNKELLDIL